jgi:alpha-1,6-mannosyltransferase
MARAIAMRARFIALFAVTAAVHLTLAYATERTDTALVLGCFGVLGASLLLQWAWMKADWRTLIAGGMLLRMLYLFATPALSDDVFRYLWDGHLTLEGISPYLLPPDRMPDAGPADLFGLMNSRPYHSIYPPVLQGVFALAAKVGGDSILAGLIALRGMVLMAEMVTVLLMVRLLRIWHIDRRNLMLYALNPVVIVEFAGNLHGEVFMLPFLLGAMLLLAQGRWGWATLPFAGAVGVKLLPLMFLPFLPHRIGRPRAVLFGAMTTGLVALMYVPFLTDTLIADTLLTLRHYFALFEFNGSVYYLIREVGYWWKGYNIIGLTAVWLPRVVAGIILLIAWRDRDDSVRGLPRQWMWAWTVYYLFATTVNPWYVAVLAVFLPFVRYRFALLWVLLVPLSYHAYGADGVMENPWLITLQYLPVYGWMALELGLFRKLEQAWALRRASVKLRRLRPLYPQHATVLEVGCGNGALTLLLRQENHIVTPLDIADLSLFPSVRPLVYDGTAFPFSDRQFHTCQLITMLHHTPDPDRLIREAMRVADRIIIMEDIYEGALQKRLTFLADSIVNAEFFGHPHTNRTDAEWRATFQKLGLRVEFEEQYRFLGLFRQVTYVLSKT